jgi:tight adherence protein B
MGEVGDMPIYYKCNMSKLQHIVVYILSAMALSCVAYLFYHIIAVSVIIGFLGAVYIEKMYADYTVSKRQTVLRLQFKEFLESMSVAVGAGNVEIQAVRSALKDLKIAYNDKADIVIEIENILVQYEKGGKELKYLFQDMADRSGLEDIQSFATIYSVIEGKSDRFGDILTQTQEIIGDKISIEQEIQTVITSAKSETNMMIVMPVIIVVAMSGMGGDLMNALFTSAVGHLAATVSLIIFAVSYIYALKVTDIKL